MAFGSSPFGELAQLKTPVTRPDSPWLASRHVSPGEQSEPPHEIPRYMIYTYKLTCCNVSCLFLPVLVQGAVLVSICELVIKVTRPSIHAHS